MPPIAGYGTHVLSDLIRSDQNFQNVLDFGEDRLYEYIAPLLAAHNEQLADEMAWLVAPTAERIVGYGGSSGVQMVETDEFGRADASQPTYGSNMGFPLRIYSVTLQWTKKWLQNHTVQEMVAAFEDMMMQDRIRRQTEVKRALFLSSNYSFADKLIDNYSLSVKRLANADGADLPPDPYGNTVDGDTHTHYLAKAGSTLAASDIDGLVTTIAEHFNRGSVSILINTAQESAVRAFSAAGQFVPVQPVSIVPSNDSVRARGPNLDTSQTNNRMIGYWGNQAAEVWVKPWIPASYMLGIMTGNGTKALAIRTRRPGSGGLVLVAQDEDYPLRAQTSEAEYGIAVRDRLTAAVLYTGGTVYADPSIAA